MKQDFLNYIQETFQLPKNELEEFVNALSRPLKKTLRLNTNKISIEDFKKLATRNNWTLGETPLGKNMFYIDREDTSLPLGHSLEHIIGYFYVQELSASSSPFYLSDDQIDEEEYMILDMSASPGGKTTQLSEYYPNALIIANELDKSRMRQLHENLDRMGAKNCYVTNYDGRFFKNFPETFDKILLDAPCSGEGTAYKSDDALKYWNIKNIRRIAKLQYQLLESAFIALKVGGELVYSTCTLNRLENEEIINKLTENYGDYFNIISLSEDLEKPLIRSWPHKNNAGGFFVVRLRKKEEISDIKISNNSQKHVQGFGKLSNTQEKNTRAFLENNFRLNLPGKFFSYRDEVYYAEKFSEEFWEDFFFYKCGIKIGVLENGNFIPNFFLGTNFGIFSHQHLEHDDSEIDTLFRGDKIIPEESMSEGYYQITNRGIPAGIVKIKNGEMRSLLETKFMRK